VESYELFKEKASKVSISIRELTDVISGLESKISELGKYELKLTKSVEAKEARYKEEQKNVQLCLNEIEQKRKALSNELKAEKERIDSDRKESEGKLLEAEKILQQADLASKRNRSVLEQNEALSAELSAKLQRANELSKALK